MYSDGSSFFLFDLHTQGVACTPPVFHVHCFVRVVFRFFFLSFLSLLVCWFRYLCASALFSKKEMTMCDANNSALERTFFVVTEADCWLSGDRNPGNVRSIIHRRTGIRKGRNDGVPQEVGELLTGLCARSSSLAKVRRIYLQRARKCHVFWAAA